MGGDGPSRMNSHAEVAGHRLSGGDTTCLRDRCQGRTRAPGVTSTSCYYGSQPSPGAARRGEYPQEVMRNSLCCERRGYGGVDQLRHPPGQGDVPRGARSREAAGAFPAGRGGRREAARRTEEWTMWTAWTSWTGNPRIAVHEVHDVHFVHNGRAERGRCGSPGVGGRGGPPLPCDLGAPGVCQEGGGGRGSRGEGRGARGEGRGAGGGGRGSRGGGRGSGGGGRGARVGGGGQHGTGGLALGLGACGSRLPPGLELPRPGSRLAARGWELVRGWLLRAACTVSVHGMIPDRVPTVKRSWKNRSRTVEKRSSTVDLASSLDVFPEGLPQYIVDLGRSDHKPNLGFRGGRRGHGEPGGRGLGGWSGTGAPACVRVPPWGWCGRGARLSRPDVGAGGPGRGGRRRGAGRWWARGRR